MRFELVLQSATSTPDDYGDEVPEWTTVETHFADVITLTGREAANAQQIKAEVTTKVVLRYSAEVLPDRQFVFGSRTLRILWINNIGQRNRELWVYCQEVVATS